MRSNGRGRFELETEAAPLRTTRFYDRIVSLQVPYGCEGRALITGRFDPRRAHDLHKKQGLACLLAIFCLRAVFRTGKGPTFPIHDRGADPRVPLRPVRGPLAPTKPFLRNDEIFLKPTSAYQVGITGQA